AAVEVTWRDATHARAHVRIIIAASAAAIDRDVAFADGDTEMERGRALGFTIASMLPEEARGAPGPTDAERPDTPTIGRTPPPPPSALAAHAVGLAFAAAAGIGGTARGFGGALDLELFANGRLSGRVGAGVRG